jgi:hypothetical protein
MMAADGAAGGIAAAETGKDEGGAANANEDGAAGFDELLKGNAAYQKAVEDRIAAAVDEQKQAAKRDVETAQAQEKAKRELEKLPEEQKAAALLKAEKERADKLQAEKDAILLRQDAARMLAEKKLPAGMVDMVIGADKEATAANVAGFEAAFNAAVAAAAAEKLPGYTPEAGKSADGAENMKQAIHDSMFGK